MRQVVLPAFFEALGVEMAAEDLQQMQPMYRLAHWKQMFLGQDGGLASSEWLGNPVALGNAHHWWIRPNP